MAALGLGLNWTTAKNKKNRYLQDDNEAAVEGNGKKPVLDPGKCLHAALLVLILVVPTTSTALFRTFHCRSYDDGTRYLVADLSIDCDDSRHRMFEAYCGFMILAFPVGVPLIFLYLLNRSRDRINPNADTELLSYAQRAADDSLEPLRVLFESYRPSVWYFEVLDLLRRNLMMGALTFIARPALRVVIGLGLAFVFALGYREIAPFSSGSVTLLSTLAMTQIVIVYFSGLIIIIEPVAYQGWVVGTLLLITTLALFISAAVMQAIRGSSQKELDQQVLENEARELDMMLSIKELQVDTERYAIRVELAEHERSLEEKSVRRLSRGNDRSAYDGKREVYWNVDASSAALSKKSAWVFPTPCQPKKADGFTVGASRQLHATT